MLLQEKYYNGDPWRVLVVCILLNRTTGRTADPILRTLFEAWPTAKDMSSCDGRVLQLLIEPLGFSNKRTEYLKDLARSWYVLETSGHDMTKLDPRQFLGCGLYAKEAWDMFVLRKRDFLPVDKELCKRMKELIGTMSIADKLGALK
jgi:methyl-CpG-binding domain protein 4